MLVGLGYGCAPGRVGFCRAGGAKNTMLFSYSVIQGGYFFKNSPFILDFSLNTFLYKLLIHCNCTKISI